MAESGPEYDVEELISFVDDRVSLNGLRVNELDIEVVRDASCESDGVSDSTGVVLCEGLLVRKVKECVVDKPPLSDMVGLGREVDADASGENEFEGCVLVAVD